jgi:hypothetical protein
MRSNARPSARVTPNPVHSAPATPTARATPLPVSDPTSPLICGPITGMRSNVESTTCFWTAGSLSNTNPRIETNTSSSENTEKKPQYAT